MTVDDALKHGASNGGQISCRFFHVKGKGCGQPGHGPFVKHKTKLETTVPLNKPHEMVYTVKPLDGNNVVLKNLP